MDNMGVETYHIPRRELLSDQRSLRFRSQAFGSKLQAGGMNSGRAAFLYFFNGVSNRWQATQWSFSTSINGGSSDMQRWWA